MTDTEKLTRVLTALSDRQRNADTPMRAAGIGRLKLEVLGDLMDLLAGVPVESQWTEGHRWALSEPASGTLVVVNLRSAQA